MSAPGNAKPLAVLYFVAAALFFAFALLAGFSDIRVASSGLVESPLVNKIILLTILTAISLFCLLLGLRYLKKSKKRRAETRCGKTRKRR